VAQKFKEINSDVYSHFR